MPYDKYKPTSSTQKAEAAWSIHEFWHFMDGQTLSKATLKATLEATKIADALSQRLAELLKIKLLGRSHMVDANTILTTARWTSHSGA